MRIGGTIGENIPEGDAMKIIPDRPEVSGESLYDIAQHAVRFALLCTAIDFKVHDFFEVPRTATAFSDRFDTDFRLTEKFLNALVAIGLLTKEDSLYMNSPVSSTYLMSKKPFFQGGMLKLLEHSLGTRWAKLGRCLREGPLAQTGEEAQVFNTQFVVAVAQWALNGGVQSALQVMASLPEFGKARRLLDIGGGHGLYAIAFCQANPQLEAVVLDVPAVIESTEDYIAQYEMQSRVRAIAGDYMSDDWGGKYDIIFAADVFFRAKEFMIPVVQKIRNSLNEGGVFVSKHQRMDENRTSPAQTVFHDLMLFLLMPFPPHTYTLKEFATLFQAGGFGVETMDVTIPHSPSGIMVSRKRELH